ncbi:MAG: hypothetical protein BAJALOKI2v1_200009 [Promethearchaeota archaeon]|nr:MAG: hypothetical protein BAJALOKI2v1_200009 [Candidatus Lokiarchaeota archaeon]
MSYEFLVEDLPFTQKAIGTDKGLAKIGDAIVNLSYSIAKSIHLSKNDSLKKPIRTGVKVSKNVLSMALKKANMKIYAKNRADAHDMADTVEAIIAYVYLKGEISIHDIVRFLSLNFIGDLTNRREERETAIDAFTKFLISIKKLLPKKVM